MEKKSSIYLVEEKFDKLRIDIYLAKVTVYSRSQIVFFLNSELVLLNNNLEKKKTKLVKFKDKIEILEKEKKEENIVSKSDFFSIKIKYESEDFLIIDKPAFFISECNQKKNMPITLLDFAKLFWTDSENSQQCRFGLVHRLDKETSGLMIIAKNKIAYDFFKLQFQLKKIQKEYIACIEKGLTDQKGEVSINIVRSPLCPVMMTVSTSLGKRAVTQYEIIAKYDYYDVVKCYPQTGRTHQIRVHLKYLGCSLIGDLVYGKKSELINRHALHAYKLSFFYFEKYYEFTSPIPEDMRNLFSE